MKQSRLWHGALERFLEEQFPGEFFEKGLLELRRRLEAEGCSRHLATIRAWVRSENTVAPLRAEEDLAAIARATDDHSFAEQLSGCLTAIRTVYRARRQARRRLRNEAFDALRAALGKGPEAWQAFEYRKAFRVVWIADIESESQLAPRTLTNQVIREGF
jgi:hypothetical protein